MIQPEFAEMRTLALATEILAVMTVLGAASIRLPAQEHRIFRSPIHQKTLGNGLRVVAVPFTGPGTVAHYVVVRTGSRNEVEPGRSGFAHFFEHMMFRGTERFSADAYNEVLRSIGADSNAFTTDDYTCYHILAGAGALDRIMEIEADRFMNLRYTQEAFQKEALAVLGEYNKNASSPFQLLFEKLQEAAFTTHTYRHTTMGFLADIEAMPGGFDYSRTFFDRWYRPDNCIVLVVGDVDPADVFARADRHWGPWKPWDASLGQRPEIPAEPEQTDERRVDLTWPGSTLPYLVMGWKAPAWRADDRRGRALDLVSELCFSENSDFHRKYVIEEQTVDFISAGNDEHRDPYLFLILARIKDPDRMTEVEAAVEAALARVAAAPPDPAALDKARSHMRYRFALGMSTADAVARTLANYINLAGDPEAVNTAWAELDRVTPEDVRGAAEAVFRKARRTVVRLRDAASAAPAVTPEALAEVRLVEISEPENPLVAIKVVLDWGSLEDPPGREGQAALLAALMSGGGTRSLPYAALVERLYPMAASISARTDLHVTTFSATVHRDTLDAFWSIFRDVLLAPRFDTADFERVRTDAVNDIERRLRGTDDENLGKATLQGLIYDGHPAGRLTGGTVAGLRACTLEDLRDLHRKVLLRTHLTLGLAGGYTPAFAARARADLAALPSGTLPRRIVPPLETGEGLHVRIVRKNARATAISLGFAIPVTRSHPDFIPLMIANSWLGEHRTFNGVLMNRMRGMRGLNYGDYSYIENFIQAGGSTFPVTGIPRRQQFFSIWIRPVAPEHARFALRMAMRELHHLVDRGLTADDFERTRTFLLHYSRLYAQDISRRLGYRLDSAWYGTEDFIDLLASELPKVTIEAVNAAVKRHLRPSGIKVAIVAADADTLAEELRAGSPSSITYTTETLAEVLAEDKEIAVWPLRATLVEVVPVESMFER